MIIIKINWSNKHIAGLFRLSDQNLYRNLYQDFLGNLLK